jgi:proteasome-associated ATPase
MSEEPKSEIEELKIQNLMLKDVIEKLRSPPFLSATVLDIGENAFRVSVDGSSVYEIPADEERRGDLKRGSRVILNPNSLAILDYSEFDSSTGEVAQVEEVMKNRLRVNQKGESYMVIHSFSKVKTGDEVLIDPSKKLAVERFGRKNTSYELKEVSNAPWSRIGGLEKTIAEIRHEIEEPFTHPKIFEKYGKKPANGVLLYGPPGCGKTMIAESIAYNLSLASNGNGGDQKGFFILINGPEILDKYVGNSEAKIRRIYETAREKSSETNLPVVVGIDEAESILKARGTGVSTDIYDTIVPQLLAEMDGGHRNGNNKNANVLTVILTNREDVLDPAIIRDKRIDKKILVPRPDKQGCSEILQIYLEGKPFQNGLYDLRNKPSAKIVSKKMADTIFNEGSVVYNVVTPKGEFVGKFDYKNFVSGAMINGIIDRACSYAIKREIGGGKTGISTDDLENSVLNAFRESADFKQSLVRSDWENVFGSFGGQYQKACSEGYLILQNELGNEKLNSGGNK